MQLCIPPTLSPPHFQLLGLSMATMAVVIHFGDPFTVIRQVALERNPYEGMHYWGKYARNGCGVGGGRAPGSEAPGRSDLAPDSPDSLALGFGQSQRSGQGGDALVSWFY